MDSFARHMFTPLVQAEQEKDGIRERFEKMYRNRFTGDLDEQAKAFIESRTSFYMASVSETGWPYVQHRGGPAGFLKVIGPSRLGFADYHGNQQYVSKGNLRHDDRVSLILMDYPRQARLKLIGHMQMKEAGDLPELAEQLAVANQGPVERIATIELAAMDWNCPKYIEPRYTRDEVTALVSPHLAKRDGEIEKLKTRLRQLGEDPDRILAD